MLAKLTYTTGDLAKLFGADRRTVSRLIDDGHIKGMVPPGGRDRRVKHKDLLAFLKSEPQYLCLLDEIKSPPAPRPATRRFASAPVAPMPMPTGSRPALQRAQAARAKAEVKASGLASGREVVEALAAIEELGQSLARLATALRALDPARLDSVMSQPV